ncbi:uncharacterized protein LOC119769224, partial [Culex quinquefasciatus]
MRAAVVIFRHTIYTVLATPLEETSEEEQREKSSQKSGFEFRVSGQNSI